MEKTTKQKKKKIKQNQKKALQDVEKIVGSRYFNNALEYEVKWKDFPDTQWLQHHELMSCLHVIEEYELEELKAKQQDKSIIGENEVEIIGSLQNSKPNNSAPRQRMHFYDEKKMKTLLSSNNQNTEVVETIDKVKLLELWKNSVKKVFNIYSKDDNLYLKIKFIAEDDKFQIKTVNINSIKEIDKDFLLTFYECFIKDLLAKAKEKESIILSTQK